MARRLPLMRRWRRLNLPTCKPYTVFNLVCSSSRCPIVDPSAPVSARPFCSAAPSDIRGRISLPAEKRDPSSIHSDGNLEDLRSQTASLAADLLASDDPAATLERISADGLLRRAPKGSAALALLSHLQSHPHLALQVFDWMTEPTDEDDPSRIPIQVEHYAKAISLAGRAYNPKLAAELFAEARSRKLVGTSLYNALMAAYMYNDMGKQSLFVFEDLKRDHGCKPTIVTYNILLSVFGRLMRVGHMELLLRTIDEIKLYPNTNTFNIAISGYITALRWDRMESMFLSMEECSVQPNTETHLLLLRGYAHSGDIAKMEKAYYLVKEHVNNGHLTSIRTMIRAYCRSNDPERVRKIEELCKFIPENQYRAWLNVLLIRLYAQEGLVEAMDRLIFEAFRRDTAVRAVGVMRSIITIYFRSNMLDSLVHFVRQAECAGWRLCRSLYHCLMVMYGQQDRLAEMHRVLDDMEVYRIDRTKKTFSIMMEAYSRSGRTWGVDTIKGIMWKHGHLKPYDEHD